MPTARVQRFSLSFGRAGQMNAKLTIKTMG